MITFRRVAIQAFRSRRNFRFSVPKRMTLQYLLAECRCELTGRNCRARRVPTRLRLRAMTIFPTRSIPDSLAALGWPVLRMRQGFETTSERSWMHAPLQSHHICSKHWFGKRLYVATASCISVPSEPLVSPDHPCFLLHPESFCCIACYLRSLILLGVVLTIIPFVVACSFVSDDRFVHVLSWSTGVFWTLEVVLVLNKKTLVVE